MTAANQKPFVRIFNADFPLNQHTIIFDGTIVKEIMRFILMCFEGRIRDEVRKAMTVTVPN